MSIAAIPSFVSGVAATSGSSNAASVPSQPTANTAADTLQLTTAERVYQLYVQGQRVSQIAETLSLPVPVVNSYLNLSNSGN